MILIFFLNFSHVVVSFVLLFLLIPIKRRAEPKSTEDTMDTQHVKNLKIKKTRQETTLF